LKLFTASDGSPTIIDGKVVHLPPGFDLACSPTHELQLAAPVLDGSRYLPEFQRYTCLLLPAN
jgi:hypothetical protein